MSGKRYHLVFNGLGAGNIGDEAMMREFLSLFPLPGGSSIEVWDPAAPVLRQFGGEYQFADYRDTELCKRKCLGADAVLLVGDTPVTEVCGPGWPLGEVGPKLTFCHENGIPCHAVCIGADLLESEEALGIFRKSYLPINSWTVRSRRSMDNLVKMGVEPERVRVSADLAWLFEGGDEREKMAGLLKEIGMDTGRPVIGVNVVNEIWKDRLEIKEELAAALDHLSRRYGYQPLFFCNETRDGEYFDMAAARETASLMGSTALIMPNRYFLPEEMISLVSFCDIVISWRYHFTVFGYLAGASPIIVLRSEKLRELSEDTGCPALELAGLSREDVINAVEAVRDSGRDSLLAAKEVTSRMRERARTGTFFLEKIKGEDGPGLFKMDHFRRILLPRLDTFGDLILLEAFVSFLLENTGAEITLLVREGYDELAPLLPPRIKWLTTGASGYLPPEGDNLERADTLLTTLDEESFDLVLFTAYNSTWLDLLVAAKMPEAQKIAIGRPVPLTPFLREAFSARGLRADAAHGSLCIEVFEADEAMPEAQKYDLLREKLFPGSAPLRKPRLTVPGPLSGKAEEILARFGLVPKDYAVCVPAGTNNVGIKAWREENFAETIAWLKRQKGIDTLVIGNRKEAERLEKVVALSREQGAGPALWMGGEGEFALAVALVAGAGFYFGNDTGLMHAASAQDVPVAAIFGGAHLQRFMPAGEGVLVVCEMPCFGCGWHCVFESAPCVGLIEAGEMKAALDELLAGGLRGACKIQKARVPAEAVLCLARAAEKLREKEALLREQGDISGWLVRCLGTMETDSGLKTLETRDAMARMEETIDRLKAALSQKEEEAARLNAEINEYMNSSIYKLARSLKRAGRLVEGLAKHKPQGRARLTEQKLKKLEGGLRTRGETKKNDPSMPSVSVVTVVFNSEREIEATIRSIAGQSYPNIEHIIIDGGSTDGTLEVIRKYETAIDYWVSERDNGIYDAMNKGVRLATGQWVSFINAGDTFCTGETVREVFEGVPPDADLVYGHTYYKGGGGMSLIETYGIQDLWMTMVFSHQSLFSRRDLLVLHPFRTDLKISSDFEFIYYCHVNGYKFFDTGKKIAVHPVDGISEQRIIKRMVERWKVVNHYTPSLKVHLFYLRLLFKKIRRVLKERG